jgi:hypothetical protein
VSAYRRTLHAAALRGGCPSTADGNWKEEYPLLSTSNIQHTGGLASSPWSCRIMPAEARTYGDGSSEMRVLLPTYESRGDVEPMVVIAGGGPSGRSIAGVR